MEEAIKKAEIGLDPTDWSDIKILGYQIIDDMIDYLKNVGERKVWTPIPRQVKDEFEKPVPSQPAGIFEVYEEFKQNILPYPGGNMHPKHFSWVQGTGTPMGAFADLLAGIMNNNATIGDQSALYIDRQVVNWCKELLNYPADGSGILVSGGSIANITGMIVARNTIIANAKNAGVYAANGKLTAYCSSETHNCVAKAAEVIGIGNEQLRKIPVNDKYEIDTEALKNKIREDKANGFVPFCIVGNAGTVNTGAIDPLDELVTIARAENIWLHIDGAFGALAKLVPAYKNRLKAIEEADSVAFDLHKWMYMPFEAGCILVRDREAHREAFTVSPSYLSSQGRGIAPAPLEFAGLGIDLARNFKALKIWFSLKAHGSAKHGRLIEQNIEQAHYLKTLIERESHLELLAPVELNVVCFRFNPGLDDEAQLNQMNEEIVIRIQESGLAVTSGTRLSGRFAIRVAVTNHRSKKVDFELLTSRVLELGIEGRSDHH